MIPIREILKSAVRVTREDKEVKPGAKRYQD